VSGVVKLLREYRERHCKDTYYETRDVDPSTLDPIERAARLIYLNKTGYNGLYRVNRSGQFNVPFGRYKNPAICDEERLRAAARALRGVKLSVADFEQSCAEAVPGDAIYFDPPYVPRSRTASFTAYHREAFGPDEHERLARVFKRLSRNRVASVLSNSDTPETRKLYTGRGFDIQTVMVGRPINSKSTARGDVSEILVSQRGSRRR
jgi:DNA adenine methylase